MLIEVMEYLGMQPTNTYHVLMKESVEPVACNDYLKLHTQCETNGRRIV